MEKECIVCKKIFETKSAKAKCCSQKCNVANWRKNNPEKNKIQQLRAEEKRKGNYRYNSEQRKSWYNKKKLDNAWKAKINAQAKDRIDKVKEFIRQYKLSKGCTDCGYNEHHIVLEFDHLSDDKELNVCNSKTIEQAQKEIAKCEVVCANCHRIRTWNRLHET